MRKEEVLFTPCVGSWEYADQKKSGDNTVQRACEGERGGGVGEKEYWIK